MNPFLPIFQNLSLFIEKFQTLIGVLVATIAVAVAIWNVNRQLQLSKKLHLENIHKKEITARALLPLTIIRIINFEEAILRDLVSMSLDKQNVGELIDHFVELRNAESIEKISVDLEKALERGNSDLTSYLQKMISKLQVHISRMASIGKKPLNPSLISITVRLNIEDFIIDSLEIIAMAENLFMYARNETEILEYPRPTLAKMRNLLRIYGLESLGRLSERVESQRWHGE